MACNLEKIKHFFSQLDIPNEFGGNLGEDNGYDWIYDWCHEYIVPYLDGDFDVAHGVSKLVLVPKEGEFVIKIPFVGGLSNIYENDEFVDECFEEFCGAQTLDETGLWYDGGWDYCQTEVDVYELAKRQGVEQFFCKTEFLCCSHNYHPIYIQEKARTRSAQRWDIPLKNRYEVSEEVKNRYNNYQKKNKNLYGGAFRDRNWTVLCFDTYGDELMEKLINFLDNCVPFVNCDMHEENYGFRADKTPCFIDYSDWNEDM